MATRAERAERKRRQILDGAAEVFLDRGFKGASTDEIARTAGVSKQTLYAYYPSKAELLGDVMRDVVDQLPLVWEPSDGRSPPPVGDIDQLRAALLDLTTAFARIAVRPEYLGLIRIVIAESADQPDLAVIFTRDIAGRLLDAVVALLAAARAGGVALDDPADPTVLVRMLAGAVVTSAILDGLLATDAPTALRPDQCDELVDRWLRAAGARVDAVGPAADELAGAGR
jgi:TetR/AcrR family transcriptional repressor of mexJK operon